MLIDLDLAEIAEDQVDLTSSGGRRPGAAPRARPAARARQGDRALLERMVGNLVENAIRHNLPDGWFSVKTGARRTTRPS